jgi:hypothetical protein
LVAQDAGESINIVASPMGPAAAVPRPQDLFGGKP